LDPCVLGRYLSGVVNDDFNGMKTDAFYRLATSRACATRHRVIESFNTVDVHRECAACWRYTVATYC
jgi:hypothetical protein